MLLVEINIRRNAVEGRGNSSKGVNRNRKVSNVGAKQDSDQINAENTGFE